MSKDQELCLERLLERLLKQCPPNLQLCHVRFDLQEDLASKGFHLQSVFDFSANLGRAGGVDWYPGSLLHCF